MAEEVEFSWEDPPPPMPRGLKESKYVRLVDQLKESPGKWALVREGMSRLGAKNLAERLSLGKYGAAVEATFVQVGRRSDGWSVYARFPVKATGSPVRRRKS